MLRLLTVSTACTLCVLVQGCALVPVMFGLSGLHRLFAGRKSKGERADDEDGEWKEYTDYDGSTFFFSAAQNKRRGEKKINEGWEYTLIGKRCRIYWPVEDKKFEANMCQHRMPLATAVEQFHGGAIPWLVLCVSNSMACVCV